MISPFDPLVTDQLAALSAPKLEQQTLSASASGCTTSTGSCAGARLLFQTAHVQMPLAAAAQKSTRIAQFPQILHQPAITAPLRADPWRRPSAQVQPQLRGASASAQRVFPPITPVPPNLHRVNKNFLPPARSSTSSEARAVAVSTTDAGVVTPQPFKLMSQWKRASPASWSLSNNGPSPASNCNPFASSPDDAETMLESSAQKSRNRNAPCVAAQNLLNFQAPSIPMNVGTHHFEFAPRAARPSP
eukprot:g6253.t1